MDGSGINRDARYVLLNKDIADQIELLSQEELIELLRLYPLVEKCDCGVGVAL